MRAPHPVFRLQEIFQREGLPALKIVEYREYGCVLCQCWHDEERDPELFAAHLFHQSKHGWRGTRRFHYL